MAANQNFRSAFNGFNREDVVHYIEYINAKHTEELNQLRSEIEFLQEKLNAPDPEAVQLLADTAAARDEFKAQLEDAQSARESLEARCAELEAERTNAIAPTQVQELESKILDLQRELTAALEAKAAAEAARSVSSMQCRMEQELEAYRRAERTERIARERAEQVYRATNGVLADATARVDEAASKISEMSDQVMFQLNLLQNAVSGSKQALKDAAATMYAIRPGEEE